jgi:hypothetical protein
MAWVFECEFEFLSTDEKSCYRKSSSNYISVFQISVSDTALVHGKATKSKSSFCEF